MLATVAAEPQTGLKPPEHRQPFATAAILSRFSHGAAVHYWQDSVRGMGMARIVNDFLLFSCLDAFVWGAAHATANLLTQPGFFSDIGVRFVEALKNRPSCDQ